MGKFLHIYINPKIGISKEEIEKKMSLAVDWYRYDDKLYVVYTTSDVAKWQERLLNFVKDDGRLFICELNIANRNGWLNKDFWAWLKKERTK